MVTSQLLTDRGGEELLECYKVLYTGNRKDTIHQPIILLTCKPTVTQEEIPEKMYETYDSV